MFRMTCDIKIGTFKPVKPNAVKWSRSVEDFSDSSTIKLPAISMLKKQGDTYERVQTGLQLTEGMNVEVHAGYDGANDLQFKGFIRRVNFTIPLEIECEGYSYQLRKKLDFSKSYRDTTVKKILEDLIQGTDIKLSPFIPSIPLEKATFVNCTGIQVLEWLKQKCLLTVYFNFDVLYVGMMQLEPKVTKKFRLGWNVIKDSELRFNDKKEFAEVRIQVGTRSKDGKKEKAFVGKKDGQVKKFKSVIKDKSILASIAQEKRNEVLNRGYEGSITAFLKPFVEPGMAVQIDDAKYPERKGKYFASAVDGESSKSGGRQRIKISNSL
jgi:hypothetical protein